MGYTHNELVGKDISELKTIKLDLASKLFRLREQEHERQMREVYELAGAIQFYQSEIAKIEAKWELP